MDLRLFKDVIAVIRAEQERRASLLDGVDPDFALDHWHFIDQPFLNQLCLMLLVTLRHQVERELVGLAARAGHGSEEISVDQYRKNLNEFRNLNRQGWEQIEKTLELQSSKKYNLIQSLRHLANVYKHEPSTKPDYRLIASLELPTEVNFAPLPESDALWGRSR